ncbi:MAG TPA: hypothetical protein VLW86_02570, partial [Syntrophorhabdales bacterium]|nr:hypothetical protein [Syntrophorhabdales bacterium]
MGFSTRGNPVANRGADPSIVGMGPGLMDAHLICDLSAMHDYFYKVLWKLLRRLDRKSGSATADDEARLGGSGAVALKKGGHALAFAGCEAGAGASTMAFNFASAFS